MGWQRGFPRGHRVGGALLVPGASPGAAVRRAWVAAAVALLGVWALAGPPPDVARAADPQFVSAAELATIGLADVEQRKVLELCLPPSTVRGKRVRVDIDVDFSVELEPPVSGRASFQVGPIQFDQSYSDTLCVNNLDFGIDVTERRLKKEGFDRKLQELVASRQIDSASPPVEVVEAPTGDLPSVQDFLDDILSRGGLLPAFRIKLSFAAVEDATNNELLSSSEALANTNPQPVAFEFPGEGEAVETVRPSWRLLIPDVPKDISRLDLTLTLEDRTDPAGSWNSPVSLSLSSAQYNRTVTVAYPAGEADLIPGHTYRAVARLVDPAGKVVGVGARAEGETVEFSVAVEPLVAERPEAGEAVRSLEPILEWSDPNPGGVRAAFSGYRVSFSETSSMDGAWSVDVGLSTSYRYADATRALQPGASLFWQVAPLSRLGVPIEAAASAVRELQVEELPEVRLVQPESGATFVEGETVGLELAELPDWSPALEVEWFDRGLRIGSGPSLSRPFDPGEHVVHAEVFLPGLPGLRSQSEPVVFNVARSLAGPVLTGIEERFVLLEPPTLTVELPQAIGGLSPYSLRLLLRGPGGDGEELAAWSGLEAGTAVQFDLMPLAPGRYELRAVVEDARGEQRETVRSFEAVAPLASLRAITADGITGVNFLMTDTLILQLTLSDPVRGRELDPAAFPLAYAWQVGSRTFDAPAPLTLSPGELPGGPVDAELSLTHPAVGELARASLTFYIASVDLVPELGPLQEAYLLGTTVPVEVSFSEQGQAPFTVELYDGGQPVARQEGLSGPPARFQLEDLGPGNHRLSARVTDAASNTAGTRVAEFSVQAPRLAGFAVLDEAGLQRAEAEADEVLRVAASVDWSAAGGDVRDLADFLRAFPFYGVELVGAGPLGGPELLASSAEALEQLRFSAGAFAGAGEEASFSLRLLLQPAGAAVDERLTSVRVAEAVVPVDLAFPQGDALELGAGALEAEVPVELLVGRPGRYRGWLEAVPQAAEAEAPAGGAAVQVEVGEFEVTAGQLPGRISGLVPLPAGRYSVRGWVEAEEVAGVEAGRRFGSQPWALRVMRARVAEAAVEVLSPVAGRYSAASPILFEGRAVNPYGDDVSDQLVWRREPAGEAIGRGASFELQLAEGNYTVSASFTAEGETVSASVRFEVFEAAEPAVAVLQWVDPARGTVLRLLDGGGEIRLREGVIVLSGWTLRSVGNPGVRGGTPVAQAMLTRAATVQEFPAGRPDGGTVRSLGSGETLTLRAGFTYVVQGEQQ